MADTPRDEIVATPAAAGSLWHRPTRNDWLLLFVGLNLILLLYTLIRHVTLAIRDLEIAVLITSLSYFSGISLGYFLSDLVTKTWIRRLLLPFLISQMLIVVYVQLGVYFLDRALPDWLTLLTVYLVVTIGSTSLYSLFLPAIIVSEGRDTRWCYSLEIIGSIIGLLLLLVAAPFGQNWVFLVYYVSFVAIAVLLGTRKILVVCMAVIIVGFFLSFDALDKYYSAKYYQRRYPSLAIKEVIYTRYSPYHKIEILHDENDKPMLMLNAHRQFVHGCQLNYAYYVAEYPARLYENPTVALIGCGSMATIGRIGNHAASIDICDLDTGVFETSRDFLQRYNHLGALHNWTFTSDDAKHFLGAGDKKWDLIIDDIPPARTRQIALTYTHEFFTLVRNRLNPGGIFSLPTLVSVRRDDSYGRKIARTLLDVFDRVWMLQHDDTSYLFGTDKTFVFDRTTLLDAVRQQDRPSVRIFDGEEIMEMVKDEPIITIIIIHKLISLEKRLDRLEQERGPG